MRIVNQLSPCRYAEPPGSLRLLRLAETGNSNCAKAFTFACPYSILSAIISLGSSASMALTLVPRGEGRCSFHHLLVERKSDVVLQESLSPEHT
jgi:hypothetical protein